MEENLKSLEEEKANKKEQLEELINKVEEEKRELTEEENKLFTELEDGIKSISDTIAKIKSARELLNEEEPEAKEEDKKEGEEEKMEEKEKRELEEFGKLVKNELIEERAEAGFSKGSNGTVIPTTIANEIVKKAFEISPILEKAKVFNVKGKLSLPYYATDDSDLTVAYGNEFTELTEKAGKFKTIDLEGHLIGVLTKISNTLLNNTNLDVANFVIETLQDYVKRFVEKEIISGTTKIKALSELKNELVEKEVNLDTLIKLKNKVKQSYRKGSMWIMNPETLTQIELIKDTTGRPILNVDPTGEFEGMILGYPVYVSDNMDKAENGKRAIYFGNFNSLVINTPQNLEIQVLKEKYATQNAIGIVGWLELDAKVQNEDAIAGLKINTSKAGA